MILKKDTHTLLIVEDDYFQQELLKIWLEAEKYNLLVAKNGEQALEMVVEYKPDLILLDLVMPKMDGFQVAVQLKQNPDTRKIPVVVVSAVDDHDKRIEALEIGIDDFLNKPVDRIELLVRVKNLLQSRAYFKQLQDRQAHLFHLESLASLGTLITSVTNEINKPLRGLESVITLAQQQSADNLPLLDLLNQAAQHIERIDLVTHNMGLYIKSATPSSTDVCDVKPILKQVLELLSNKMADADIQIHTNIAPNLPLVQCSAEGLMHVLVHLLLNAYDTLESYPQPHINISISVTDDKEMIISVCDNNAESAENLYSLIVDPLFSAKLPDVCTGLGLALACHFIENSGGNISIDSANGRGCCMQVVLKTA